MDITRATVMEINISNFKYNIEQIKNKLGKNINMMPIIKANAYGTYINTRLDLINEFDIVGVAIVDEGVELRKLGYEKEIFVLNQAYKPELEKIIKYNLTVGVSSLDFINAIGKLDEEVKIHIEIGSGMGRTGIHPDHVKQYVDEIRKCTNIKIDGIYTHLSVADTDEEYTKKQLASFDKAVEVLRNEIGYIKYIHASASNGIVNYSNDKYNLVRPGIIMYGYKSAGDTLSKIDLKPIAKLKSKITYLKDVEKGTSISYGRTFKTERKSKIATIPIGYADGLRRILSNNFYVYINGKKAPIVGKICMDGFMADVTDIPDVKLGDDVVIWDNENITLEEIAEKCDTINYEIISTISNRVPRMFIE